MAVVVLLAELRIDISDQWAWQHFFRLPRNLLPWLWLLGLVESMFLWVLFPLLTTGNGSQ